MSRWWRCRKLAIPAAAPRISFLLGDLEEKIQVQALETTGLLRNRGRRARKCATR